MVSRWKSTGGATCLCVAEPGMAQSGTSGLVGGTSCATAAIDKNAARSASHARRFRSMPNYTELGRHLRLLAPELARRGAELGAEHAAEMRRTVEAVVEGDGRDRATALRRRQQRP